MWKTCTASPEDTRRLAEILGSLLQPGDVIALFGELGSGKTVFAQGLARGLQVPESYYITSPTFSIVNEYPGRIPFYHIDLYRVAGDTEVEELGLVEIL
ncbi:MAG: tRNA (adenosine(37)-N6)-threonylcarbamoyltransferase complex ATPase subunit type 1 TsaE, partial [Deltaproteobacteria bacterium]|nr:tRNA (adenosine(37)-N6)-threonylcarbamoyltransferase complex ATPase subunit type 1 TsaE [Deltaproteobacteria bacterium]